MNYFSRPRPFGKRCPLRPVKVRNFSAFRADKVTVRICARVVSRIVNVVESSDYPLFRKLIQNPVDALSGDRRKRGPYFRPDGVNVRMGEISIHIFIYRQTLRSALPADCTTQFRKFRGCMSVLHRMNQVCLILLVNKYKIYL